MEREQLTATVRAAQQGDEKALNLLFNTYYNDVYYFALRTLKDEDLACDITQETFVEIINTLQDLKEPAAFVTWMRQVTYHQCTRYFKKKKEVLVEEDEDGNSVFDTLEEEREEFIPGEGVDKEDFRATILALLDTLSEEQRAAVLMHYYHEMSVKDIAEAQQVSEGTAKSRLNYARKSLKKSVEDYEKKHDVKLHCAGVLPLLLWLFASSGKEVMPVAAAKTLAGGVATATGIPLALSTGSGVATATATVTAGTGLMAKIAALPVAVKIISGITAGALLIGSVAVVNNELRKDPEPTTPVIMETEPTSGNNQQPSNPTNETVVQTQPTGPQTNIPPEDTPPEDTPTEDIPSEDIPSDDTPSEETPSEDIPSEDVPPEDPPSEDAPSDDTSSEDTPSEADPVEPMAYIVPEGCTYYYADGTEISAGNEVRSPAAEGDRLVDKMYEYTYSTDIDGWKASTIASTLFGCDPFRAEINCKPLISLAGIFAGDMLLGECPEIPDSVTDLRHAFYNCSSLRVAPAIPDGVIDMESTFYGCIGLSEAPEIPASVKNMTQTFAGCSNLSGEVVIHATPTAFAECFSPYITNHSVPPGTTVVLAGTGGNLEELAATSPAGNVTVDPALLNEKNN